MNKKTRARSHSSSNPRAALIIDYWKPQTLIWDCVVINVINDEDANVPRINAIPIHIDTPNPTGNTNTPSNGWWLLYCCDLVSVWSTSAHDSFCVCLYYSYSTLQTNIMCVNNNKIWFVVPLSGAVARSSYYRKDTSSSCSSYGLWYLRVFMCVWAVVTIKYRWISLDGAHNKLCWASKMTRMSMMVMSSRTEPSRNTDIINEAQRLALQCWWLAEQNRAERGSKRR